MSLARASQSAADVAVPGEFLFTWADFAVIADLLYRMSGIHLPEGKATLVYSRVAKRVRALGLPDFETYCDLVRSPGTEEEHSALLSALTTNVTRFFRESHHFDHLRDHVLPQLAQAAKGGARVRMWSAGCSAGHEPYSMAMTVLEAIPDAASLDVRILASDIDPLIVKRAADAAYSGEDVEPVPGPLRSRHLVRNGTAWTVSDDVRRLVSFRTLNLLGDWPMRGRFDVIFCRNVAIYFDDPTQTRLFGRFGEAMNDLGQLYIGHSERAFAPTLIPDGLTSYRRTPRHG